MASLLVSPGPLLAFSPILRHRRPVHHLAGASSLQSDVVEKIPAAESGVGEESEQGCFHPFPPIKAAKRVVLVRHGQSTWNAEGRIQGSSDFSVLTPKGESQAETSRQMLLSDNFDACFSSPLIRSKRTAEIIWGGRSEEIIPESDLREIDLYSFQGLLKHEGKAQYGNAYRQWQIDAANFNIDGHYPVRELWARARNCWGKILSHDGKSVLIVAHNAVNQALVATAMGLGTEYFRILLQSNCGVTVLDFTPKPDNESPHICLNRLNQTPNSPLTSGTSGGRKTSKRIMLVCYGVLQDPNEVNFSTAVDRPMNMLGLIQSQKISEILLDVKVSSIFYCQRAPSRDTASVISQVQEAADCLGADCVPRYVDMKQYQELEVEHLLELQEDGNSLSLLQPSWVSGYPEAILTTLWERADKVWSLLLKELSDDPDPEKNVVVVGHPALHIALIAHCLHLKRDRLESFHLDAGSISVIDFPDGPTGRGVIRCINYTAHLGRWSIPVTRSYVEDDEF